MSLVPDYEDSDDGNTEDDSAADSESPDTDDDGLNHETNIYKLDGSNKKESLPSASFLFSSESKPGAVFNNPFKAAENAKIASLEKHVKMVSTDHKIKTINGKKICWNYRKGRCRFGSKCKFAHDSDIQTSNDGTKGQFESTTDNTINQTSEIPANSTPILVTNDIDVDSMKKKRNKKRPGLNTCIIPNKQAIKVYSGQT